MVAESHLLIEAITHRLRRLQEHFGGGFLPKDNLDTLAAGVEDQNDGRHAASRSFGPLCRWKRRPVGPVCGPRWPSFGSRFLSLLWGRLKIFTNVALLFDS